MRAQLCFFQHLVAGSPQIFISIISCLSVSYTELTFREDPQIEKLLTLSILICSIYFIGCHYFGDEHVLRLVEINLQQYQDNPPIIDREASSWFDRRGFYLEFSYFGSVAFFGNP